MIGERSKTPILAHLKGRNNGSIIAANHIPSAVLLLANHEIRMCISKHQYSKRLKIDINSMLKDMICGNKSVIIST